MLDREKPERAQRADLALPVGDRGVHRDHRADHRADREEDRHDRPEDADEDRRPLRLLLVERRLAQRLRPSRLSFSTPARNASNFAGESRRTRTLETTPSRP